MFVLVVGGMGLVATLGSIFGIVMLARAIGTTESAGGKAAAVVGIVCLCLFAVAGLAATGCAALVAAGGGKIA